MDVHVHYKESDQSLFVSHRKRDTENHMPIYHSHIDRYEMYYLIDGERKYFIKDRTYHVPAGSLVFINKGDLHRTFHVTDYAHERIMIQFTDDFQKQMGIPNEANVYRPFQQTTILQLNLTERQQFEHILYAMVHEMKQKTPGFAYYMKVLLTQLLINSSRYVQQNDIHLERYTGNMYDKVTDIVHYIDSHFHQSLTLTEIASTFYVSTYYLSRIFKEATGFSISEYIIHVRVREAQRLLRESDAKIIDIANKVGFNSVPHFGRMFKKVTSYSPSAYRKQYRKK